MTGHFYFGNNGDVPLRRILYDVFYLFLRVKSGMWRAVKYIAGPTPCLRHPSFAANLCKFWIFFYFDAPTLVIGEMPVKNIHLKQCHLIHEVFYYFFSLEITSLIQQKTAPEKSRLICYS